MVIYVYRCPVCSYQKDVCHSIMEDPKINCPEDGVPMRRVPQGFGVSLKGGGWAGKTSRAGIGDADNGIPPALPREFGGTLNTDPV